MWVNHEYINPLFVKGPKSGDDRYNLLYNQGGSIIEVYQENNTWKMDTNSKFARRVTGLTPFQVTGAGSSMIGREVIGTFANCSGGMTLWNTVLTCEENYESTSEEANLDPNHYGWVCEIDPFNSKFAVRKHTALGRFHHENTAMGLSKDGRVVVYMGDDVKDACVYKFISNGKYEPAAGIANSKLLEEGTLYAADLKKGKWIALTLEAAEKKAPGKYKSQGEILVKADEVAILLGATPTDRPEDLEISPFDNTIFIAHTNNDKHGNIHGHITRFYEKDNDLASAEFDFEIFAAGGRQSGFSAPDNLTFDSNANLWVVTDISSSSLNKGVFTHFQNNGLFVIPTVGPNAGEAIQFASAPIEAELTGPWFTPDEKTLFLAIQHPGEETSDLSKPTSMWPHRTGDTMPRPSVVAITGFKF